MGVQCRYSELKAQLDQGIQQLSQKCETHRFVDVTAHRDFLTVSWLGNLDYWRALALEKETERLRKTEQYKSVAKDRLRLLGFENIRPRFAHKQAREYAVERVVFYKTSNLVPESLEKFAPDCAAGFREAPLHRHVVLARYQPAADEGGELAFVHWRIQPAFHRNSSDLVARLLEEIFPPALPELARKPRWWWRLVIAAAVSGLLVLSGYLALEPGVRDALAAVFGPGGDAQRDTELDLLRSQLEQRLDEQESARGREGAASEARLAGLESEISNLSERLAALTSLRTSDLHLDRVGAAACLPVRYEGHRAFPTYIYAITLDQDAGISLRALPDGLASARAAGYPTISGNSTGQLGIAEFESLVRPLSDEARNRSCRHFALLIENDPQDAGRYIAQREAIERHFYVFRP